MTNIITPDPAWQQLKTRLQDTTIGTCDHTMTRIFSSTQYLHTAKNPATGKTVQWVDTWNNFSELNSYVLRKLEELSPIPEYEEDDIPQTPKFGVL